MIVQTDVDIVKIPLRVTTNQGIVLMDVNFILKSHTVKVPLCVGAGIIIKFMFIKKDVFPFIKQEQHFLVFFFYLIVLHLLFVYI